MISGKFHAADGNESDFCTEVVGDVDFVKAGGAAVFDEAGFCNQFSSFGHSYKINLAGN